MCNYQETAEIVRKGNPKKERFLQFLSGLSGLFLLPLIYFSISSYKANIISTIELSSNETASAIVMLRNDVVNMEAINRVEKKARDKLIDERCIEVNAGINRNNKKIIENSVKIHEMHNEKL